MIFQIVQSINSSVAGVFTLLSWENRNDVKGRDYATDFLLIPCPNLITVF